MSERVKIMIRAVMCLLLMCTSAVSTYTYLMISTRAAFDTEVFDYSLEVYSVADVIEESAPIFVESVHIDGSLFASSKNREIVYETLEQRITIPASELYISGTTVVTDPVSVDVDSLVVTYNQQYPDYEWDTKDRINVISTLWDFLVNQNDVDEVIASAMIGSMMYEGLFAEEQGSYRKLSGIDDARNVLGDGVAGYGVAQWTYKTRQMGLLNYYELANEALPNNWDSACIVAECCMLLREVEAYEIFESMYSHTTIEDAVGRMCLLYEKYEGSDQQWSSEGGFHLISNKGSGRKRLDYSQNIYNHFCGG